MRVIRIERAVAGADRVEVAGVGHLVPHGAPDLLADITLNRFRQGTR